MKLGKMKRFDVELPPQRSATTSLRDLSRAARIRLALVSMEMRERTESERQNDFR